MKVLLDQCVSRSLYGDEAATIRHFSHLGIERLLDQHRLIDVPTVAGTASTDATSDE
jgi:hypothetical protein